MTPFLGCRSAPALRSFSTRELKKSQTKKRHRGQSFPVSALDQMPWAGTLRHPGGGTTDQCPGPRHLEAGMRVGGTQRLDEGAAGILGIEGLTQTDLRARLSPPFCAVPALISQAWLPSPKTSGKPPPGLCFKGKCKSPGGCFMLGRSKN